MNPDTSFAVATAPKRNSKHWRAGAVTWAELLSWAESPADRKEAGNYLLGTLRPDTTVLHPGDAEPCGPNRHRRKDFVVSRSALTLDIDTPARGFADKVELLLPYAALMHTTFNSSPDEPRYRLIIPTDRPMLPDEYVAAAGAVMASLGVESFDPGSDQPERYMFKPSAQQAEWYESLVLDGDPAVVDALLVDFEEDLSEKPMPRPHRNKRNPFELDGIVGAFNCAYEDLALLVETYELPYEEVSEGRWQLLGSRAVAGMGPVQGTEGLFYSHHANDPAYGQTCSAFDLVRLHRFGELDEGVSDQTPINRLKSHESMCALATQDVRALGRLVGGDFPDDLELAAEDWRGPGGLARTNRGVPTDVIGNWDLWSANDPAFKAIFFNELTQANEIDTDLPWRTIDEGGVYFTTTDRKNLRSYMQREYNGFTPTRLDVEDAVDMTAARRRRNPIREYLDPLVWDGVLRVEESLPGVRPTDYSRMVARKCLVAAVARVFEPGCKWDHTLVLQGDEGLGKSWWIDKVFQGYSASLGRIDSKDTLLIMQRSWVMVADEGHSLRKGDSDVLKEFLTRTEDVFRMPYDRETMAHKRHSVIWSTINDETFLRRQEGNRRFLVVHCEDKVDFDTVTQDYVDQLWAEAVFMYKAGEKLFLDADQSTLAAAERERYVEEDAIAGALSEYLETPVPDEWFTWNPDQRRMWYEARHEGFEDGSTNLITEVCSLQLFVEALGKRQGDHRRVDLLDITNAMKRLPGWRIEPGRRRLTGYGPQVAFTRTQHHTDELAELL